MGSPLYGNNFSYKMNSPAFIRLSTGTKLTKPATPALAMTEFYGEKASDTITLATGLTGGEYFTFDTPNSWKYGFYVTVNAVGDEPTLAGIDKWIVLAVGTGYTVAELKAVLIEELKSCNYVSYVSGTGANIANVTITAKQGGLCDGLVDGNTGFTVVNVKDGVGQWALIGKLTADPTSDPEHNELDTSEGGKTRLSTRRNIMFSFHNPNAHAVKVIEDEYNGQQVDIAFFNVTDSNYPYTIWYNMPLNADFNVMGEAATIDFELSKQAKKESTYRDTVDYSY